jgi:hypothetical protein
MRNIAYFGIVILRMRNYSTNRQTSGESASLYDEGTESAKVATSGMTT